MFFWKKKKEVVQENFFQQQMEKRVSELVDFRNIEIFTREKKQTFLSNLKISNIFATLIIGFKANDEDPTRMESLLFLLKWLDHYYGDMFDVLLVEQGRVSHFNIKEHDIEPHVRYEFLFNPDAYNRGWGYNVAVKHFCPESKIVILMDVDVLTGYNFVSEVRDCYLGHHDIISPYQNVYYTDSEEASDVKSTMNLSCLSNDTKIKNPVTICGGIVIFNKKTFLSLNGFEQYTGYCCEDRALDTIALTLCDSAKIRIAPVAYAHLYHPTDKSARANFDSIYKHLVDNYNCKWDPSLKETDFIHLYCKHISKDQAVKRLIDKSHGFAEIDLYKQENGINVNGTIKKSNHNDPTPLIIPPEFDGLSTYQKREIYKAPDPDIEELEPFYNAFLGERCFIIGNGPSLNKHDLSCIQDEYTFGVNSFYYKTRETGFRPFFYVVEDSSVMKENIDEIRNYHAPFKFFPTIYKNLHPKDPNTFFFKMNRGFYEKSSPNYVVPRFSTDATKELFCGQSVTYINLQLAFYMGFTEVYLIGMDFDYVIPESHKRTGDVLLSDTDDPNHFHKDYFGKGKTWKDPKLERVALNYKMAKLVYESVGRNVYNATIGGKLEVFDRVEYKSLFS